jgi:hypothetical protein
MCIGRNNGLRNDVSVFSTRSDQMVVADTPAMTFCANDAPKTLFGALDNTEFDAAKDATGKLTPTPAPFFVRTGLAPEQSTIDV